MQRYTTICQVLKKIEKPANAVQDRICKLMQGYYRDEKILFVCHRIAESNQSNGMGATDEQHQQPSLRGRLEGVDLCMKQPKKYWFLVRLNIG